MGACIPMPRHTYAGSTLHACWNPDLDRLGPAHAAFATTHAANGLNLPRTSTPRASDIKTHAAADLRDVARTAADFAGLRRAHCSCATARGARLETADRHFLYPGTARLPKINLNYVLEAL